MTKWKPRVAELVTPAPPVFEALAQVTAFGSVIRKQQYSIAALCLLEKQEKTKQRKV